VYLIYVFYARGPEKENFKIEKAGESEAGAIYF